MKLKPLSPLALLCAQLPLWLRPGLIGATAAVIARRRAVKAAVAAVEVLQVVETHGEGGRGHRIVAGEDALPGAFEAHAALVEKVCTWDRKLEQQMIDARDYEALELAVMKHLMGVK